MDFERIKLRYNDIKNMKNMFGGRWFIMTTVVNTPPSNNQGGNGMGFLVGIVLLIVVGFLFFVYGLPMLRQSTQAPQINVPDKIDVNIQQTK